MNTKKSTLLSIALLSMHLLPFMQAAQDPNLLSPDEHESAELDTTVVSNQEEEKEDQALYNQVLSYLVFGEKENKTTLDKETYTKFYRKSIQNLVTAREFLVSKVKADFKNQKDGADLTRQAIEELETNFEQIMDYMTSIDQEVKVLVNDDGAWKEHVKAIFTTKPMLQVVLEPEKIELTTENRNKIQDEINKIKTIRSACDYISDCITYEDCGLNKQEREKAEEKVKAFAEAESGVITTLQMLESALKIIRDERLIQEFNNLKIENKLLIQERLKKVNFYQYYQSLSNKQEKKVALFVPVKDSNLASTLNLNLKCKDEDLESEFGKKFIFLGQTKYSLEYKSKQLGILIAAAQTFLIKYLFAK